LPTPVPGYRANSHNEATSTFLEVIRYDIQQAYNSRKIRINDLFGLFEIRLRFFLDAQITCHSYCANRLLIQHIEKPLVRRKVQHIKTDAVRLPFISDTDIVRELLILICAS
jgi:hypothetical protein